MLAAGRATTQREARTASADEGGKMTMGMSRVFADRIDAGERLARAVVARVDGPTVVLGVPRGGVLVAAPVAAARGAPLDVVVPRKLGAPGNPELAFGAVATGVRVVDDGIVAALGIDEDYLEAETARAQAEVVRRTEAYRRDRPPLDVSGRTVVIVDDGVATGATALAALAWARGAGPARVVFAAPVGPPPTVERLAAACDVCIVLETPEDLRAVGQWYRSFGQVHDAEVVAALAGRSP
jgi:putative phosphoribosyl transferase